MVADLLKELSDEAKTELLTTPADELIKFHHSLGAYIRNHYKLWHNQELLNDIGTMDPDDASVLVIESVWEKLQSASD